MHFLCNILHFVSNISFCILTSTALHFLCNILHFVSNISFCILTSTALHFLCNILHFVSNISFCILTSTALHFLSNIYFMVSHFKIWVRKAWRLKIQHRVGSPLVFPVFVCDGTSSRPVGASHWVLQRERVFDKGLPWVVNRILFQSFG